jgi:CxxC motif-containing protein (DUF1111 family)
MRVVTLSALVVAGAIGTIGTIGIGGTIGCVGADSVDTSKPVLITEDNSDDPLSDLTPELQKAFDDGDAFFEARMFSAQGLGPLYIRTSCASCHANDGKGPGFVQKMAAFDDDGALLPLPFGNTVHPFVDGGATTPILPPDGAVHVSTRIGPAVFGRGFVEAIDDAVIEGFEAAQRNRDDGISGRIHRVRWQSAANPDPIVHDHQPGDEGLIGRFGLKGRIATLDEFTADAFQGDMGITSPMRPTEIANPDGVVDDFKAGVDIDNDRVNAVAMYMRLVDMPRRDFVDVNEADGAAVFAEARCAVCHVPEQHTAVDWAVAPLADRTVFLFTDLLLHDMGEGLKDDIVDGDASGREWKTPPLLGNRFFDGYLHDGRSKTVREAIAAHSSDGSEANDSVARFNALSAAQQDLLVRYVESL